jgi:NitT/TauT family transport system permease protein
MTMISTGAQGAALSATVTENELAQIEDLRPSPARTPSGRLRVSTVLGPVIVFVGFIGLWEYFHRSGMRRWFDKPGFLLPSPVTVIDGSWNNPQVREQLIDGLGWTTLAALVGLAITIVLGTLLAMIMAQASWLEGSFYPYLVALQAIPVLAVVPLIYSIFGGGMGSRIFVCVMISIFPIVTNTLFGLKSAEVGQHDLFTLRGASRTTRLFRLQFPAAMPSIFTGFRISAGLSVIGAVVGEQFFRTGGKPGIGVMVEQFRQKARYPQVYGGLIVAALLGIAVFFVFGLIAKLVVGHWHESSRKSS